MSSIGLRSQSSAAAKELSGTEIHVPLNISNISATRHVGSFLTLCLLSTFPFLPIPVELSNLLREWLRIVLVILMGWFAIGCTFVFRDALMHRYDLATENNVRARRIHTQMHFLFRMLIGFIVIVDIGCILWTFPNPQLWRYGSGLLPRPAWPHWYWLLPRSPLSPICSPACRSLSLSRFASTMS